MDIDHFKDTFHFLAGSDTPLYMQLVAYFRLQIQAGVLKPGDKMLSENDLCKVLHISRTTVRLCMEQLAGDGLLLRFRGKGSFIADRRLKRNINYLYSFSENIRAAGAVPTSIVLESKIVTVSKAIAKNLQLPEKNSKVFKLKRLRCANREPVIVECSYIPYYFCPEIEKIDFSETSLYETLHAQYNMDAYHAVETIGAILIDPINAGLLHCAEGAPGYRIERISNLESGYVFEYTVSATRADKCEFRLDLYAKTSSNKIDFERRINF